MAKSKLNKGVGIIDTLFIEEPKRAIVIGVFLVVIIILLVLFWSRIKSAFSSIVSRKASNDALQEVISETGQGPSLSNATFSTMANSLYQAMHGFGTTESTIYNVYGQLSNLADVYKLNAAFGMRDNRDLPTYIRSELTNREINKLNGILAAKGIAYSF